jgi:hypothetical protein
VVMVKGSRSEDVIGGAVAATEGEVSRRPQPVKIG